MKRRGLIIVLAVLLAATLMPPAGAVAAEPQQMVDVVVVMKSQANLGAIRETDRPARLAAVERTLRAYASQTQKGVLTLLASRKAQGLASRIVPVWISNEVAVHTTPAVVRELAGRPDVREVRPEFTVEAPTSEAAAAATSTVEPNVSLVNAPALWSMGFRGQGVVVANMDTGVDATHPDLAAKWRGGTNSWYDPNGQHPTTPTDVSGHGTQTMSVMVGGDVGGSSIGVAPDAKWIAVKIFNDHGTATSTRIHQGFQWLLDPDGNPNTADAPNVVNNSWTTMTTSCLPDFQPDLGSLRAAGILPVFAAGNSGPNAGTVLSPANLPEALAVGGVGGTVGGTDGSDVVYPYSSRGPSACAGATAPTLVAPAVDIRTADLYAGYVQDTGTSVAAPHVAGALALLLSAFPELSADRQEAALESGAVDLGAAGLDNDFGYGRLDALAAYQWLAGAPDFTVGVSPSSATVTAGESASFAVSVTGANSFAGDVTLDLSGLSAPPAMWSFSPPVVEGGTGNAQLSVTTATPGTYPLTISATSGAITHTASVMLNVTPPPDFSLAATPANRTVNAGTGTSYSVSVGALNGFSGSVALSVGGLPPSVGATFTPSTVTGSGTSQLAIAGAPAGSYSLTITGSSGSLVRSTAVTLTVVAADFALSASPSSVTVSRGKTASYTVSTASVAGFSGSVSLTVSGLPAYATATWVSNPITTPGTTTLRVKTSGSTPRGTAPLRISGTGGTLSHQVTVTLVVR